MKGGALLPTLLLAAALALGGCGKGEDADDAGNASAERSMGAQLHAGPAKPKADGVQAPSEGTR